MKELSVIISICNSLQETKNLLQNLKENFNFELGELCLIDNNSDTETSTFLNNFCEQDSSIKLLNNLANQSLVKKYNLAIKNTNGKILVFLNSEAVIPRNFCEHIIDCFNSDFRIAIAIPITSYPSSSQISLPDNMTLDEMNKKLSKIHKAKYSIFLLEENPCFCIRKDILVQQDYFDENYLEDYFIKDFVFKAISNNWKSVLIDNLYIGNNKLIPDKKEKSELLKKDEEVFGERWNSFELSYLKENNYINPIRRIKKALGIDLYGNQYGFFDRIFSIKNSADNKTVITKFFGLTIKHKKLAHFPKNSKNVDITFNRSKDFRYKKAVIFAGFNVNGQITDNVVKYLTELNNYTDYIIYINDNPILDSEIAKVETLVDRLICKKHGEYDFGSYKRGFFMLKELGVLDKVDKLLICNDSVEYVGNSLENVIRNGDNADFYGMTQHGFGFVFNKKSKKYEWTESLHIQSWFLEVSDKIFNTLWFEDFFKNVRKERNKHDIIIKYEQGFSKLIASNGFKLSSFYPATKETLNKPEIYYNTQDYKNKIFIKRNLLNK